MKKAFIKDCNVSLFKESKEVFNRFNFLSKKEEGPDELFFATHLKFKLIDNDTLSVELVDDLGEVVKEKFIRFV